MSVMYIYHELGLLNEINSRLDDALRFASEEVLKKLQSLINSDVYGTEMNISYEPTYEFLEAFAFDEVVKRKNFAYTTLNYDSNKVLPEIVDGNWNIHASVYGEDVSKELYDILNVSGLTSPIGVKFRKPYLDNFYDYMDNNYSDIMRRALIKSGLPIS